jgi:two-component system, sensor histidine kinase and response regulator
MKKILVIEDDSQILEALEDILTYENYEVHTASNGRLGVEAAIKHTPDLIISDIMMPELDGYGVLAELRKNPATFAIPFLFLTAKADKSSQRYGMEIGADDYITKPFENEEIIKAVNSRLEKYSTIEKHFNKKVSELQSYLTASLPHELRSPLNVILGFSQIIDGSKKDELNFDDVKMMNKNIMEAGKRLLRIVINYSFFTKLYQIESRGKNNVNNQVTSIPVCDNPKIVISDFATEIARKYRREGDLVLMLNNSPVMIPEEYLIKVVEEVADNAFKFSYNQTKVKIISLIEDDYYYVSFTNSGRGMKQEQIKNIGLFMQFERNTHEQQGTGLGLAIVKKIIELYGGVLTIESVPNEFITLKITIPLKK